MATIRRFFTEHVGKEAILSGDEYSHAKNVLRLKEGDEILLLDGSGKEYDAIINKVTKGEMLCTVVSERISDKECKTKIPPYDLAKAFSPSFSEHDINSNILEIEKAKEAYDPLDVPFHPMNGEDSDIPPYHFSDKDDDAR